MFKHRIITALIGVPLITALMYAGGWYGRLFFVIIALLGIIEFYGMMRNSQQQPMYIVGCLWALILLLPVLWGDYYQPLLLAVLFLAVGQLLMSFPKINIVDMGLSFFLAGYVAFMLSYAVKIQDYPHSFTVIMFGFILVWSSDIGGYLAGKKWGKSRMAPDLSPKKSWEGFVGALIATNLAAFIFCYFTEFRVFTWPFVLLSGTVVCIAAHTGDLFVSSAKRYYKVKDSGNLLPGHGGILDRFDSFILVVPIIYYLTK